MAVQRTAAGDRRRRAPRAAPGAPPLSSELRTGSEPGVCYRQPELAAAARGQLEPHRRPRGAPRTRREQARAGAPPRPAAARAARQRAPRSSALPPATGSSAPSRERTSPSSVGRPSSCGSAASARSPASTSSPSRVSGDRPASCPCGAPPGHCVRDDRPARPAVWRDAQRLERRAAARRRCGSRRDQQVRALRPGLERRRAWPREGYFWFSHAGDGPRCSATAGPLRRRPSRSSRCSLLAGASRRERPARSGACSPRRAGCTRRPLGAGTGARTRAPRCRRRSCPRPRWCSARTYQLAASSRTIGGLQQLDLVMRVGGVEDRLEHDRQPAPVLDVELPVPLGGDPVAPDLQVPGVGRLARELDPHLDLRAACG